MIKRLALFACLATLAGVFASGCAADSSSQPTKVGEVEEQEAFLATQDEQTTFAVGEKVELDGLVVTLVSVNEWTGEEYFGPSDGNIYLQCEFEIENNSDKQKTVSSMLDFSGYCDGYSINESIGALGSKSGIDGEVHPGKKLAGALGYEVPTDWKEVEIHFTPSFLSNKEIVFIAQH